jgi:hypothetical protein
MLTEIPFEVRYRAFYLRRGKWIRRLIPTWRVYVKPLEFTEETWMTTEVHESGKIVPSHGREK